MPSWNWFWVFKVSSKIWVLTQTQLTMLSRITHMTILSRIHSCDECRKLNKLTERWWQTLVHFVSVRANLFTDQRMSSLQFWQHKLIFLIQFESTLWTILQPFPVPSSWNYGRPNKELSLYTTALSSYSPLRNIVRRTFSRDHPHRMTTRLFLREVLHKQKIVALRRRSWCEHLSVFLNDTCFGLHSRWIHPTFSWSRNDVGSPRLTSFINLFDIRLKFCFLSKHFDVIPHENRSGQSLFPMNKKTFPIRHFFKCQ